QADRHRDAVQIQPRTNDQRGDALRKQRFSVHMDARVKLIVLGLMLNEVEVGKIAAMNHDWLASWAGAEGQDDAAFLVRRIIRAAKPDRCVLNRSVRVIKDRDDLPQWAGTRNRPQFPLANERPAAFARANEIDDINARTFELRKCKAPADPAERRFAVVVRL